VKPYLISVAVGLLVGLIYSLLGVRSPAPPAIALLGLLGMLLGEQVVPIAKRIFSGKEVVAFMRTDCAEHVLGMPIDKRQDEA
jgi:XapX domain-containing protein